MVRQRNIFIVFGMMLATLLAGCKPQDIAVTKKLLLLEARFEITHSENTEIVSKVRFIAESDAPVLVFLPWENELGIGIAFLPEVSAEGRIVLSEAACTERILAEDILGDDTDWFSRYAMGGDIVLVRDSKGKNNDLASHAETTFLNMGEDIVLMRDSKGKDNDTVSLEVIINCKRTVDRSNMKHIESSLFEIDGERLHQINVAIPETMSGGVELRNTSIERAETLKASLHPVSIRFIYHRGPQDKRYYRSFDKPYYQLLLTTGPLPPEPLPPWHLAVGLEKNDFENIIDFIAQEGYLGRAISYDMADPKYEGPTYTLRVEHGKGFYEDVLGWGPPMLTRMEEFKSILNGRAGESMEKLLSRFEGERERWERKRRDITKFADESQLIVLGKVIRVFDGRHRDAGIGYDIEVLKVFKGRYSKKEVSFQSGGWFLYAEYDKGETVLAFLKRNELGHGRKWDQAKPVVYLDSSGEHTSSSVGFWEVEECIKALNFGGIESDAP